MNSTLFFEGKKYISARRAAQVSGYSADYIGQLCRAGSLDSRMIGRGWFVSEISLLDYKKSFSSAQVGNVSDSIIDSGVIPIISSKSIIEKNLISSSRDIRDGLNPQGNFIYSHDNKPLIPELRKSEDKLDKVLPISYSNEVLRSDSSSPNDAVIYSQENKILSPVQERFEDVKFQNRNFHRALRGVGTLFVLSTIVLGIFFIKNNFRFEEFYNQSLSLVKGFTVERVFGLNGIKNNIANLDSGYFKNTLNRLSGDKLSGEVEKSPAEVLAVDSKNNIYQKIGSEVKIIFSGVKNYFTGLFGGGNKFADNKIVPLSHTQDSGGSRSSNQSSFSTKISSSSSSRPIATSSGKVSVNATTQKKNDFVVASDITRREVLDLIKQYDDDNKALIYTTSALTVGNNLSINQSISDLKNRISSLEQKDSLVPRQLDHPYNFISGGSSNNTTSFDGVTITNSSFSGSTGTFSGAVTIGSNLTVSGSATSTFANGIDLAGGCFSINGVCVGGNISSAVTSIGGEYSTAQTGSTQTLATSSPDANLGMTITSSSNTHTFTPYWIGQLGVARGGTGLSSISSGDLIFASGVNTFSTLASTTGAGRFLTLDYSTGRPSWVATSSLNINLTNTTGTLAVGKGGTGVSTFGGTNTLLYTTSADTLSSIAAGTGGYVLGMVNGVPAWTATTTFSGGLSYSNGNVTANCVDITGSLELCDGSDAVGGGAGGGTWSTTTSQVPGRLINYSNNTNDVVVIGGTASTTGKWWYDPTTTVGFLNGSLGIGTTSPNWNLSVAGTASIDNYLRASYFTATTSIASAFPYASTTMITATTASSTNLIVSGNSTLGTVISGLWNGTSIGNSYVDDDITLTNITQITNRAITDTTGTLTVARGGTGQTSFGQGWLHSDGTTFTSSTSPTVNYIVATSTTATSTFAWGIQTNALNVTSTTASSTFANGIVLSKGCVLMPNGTCLGAGGSGTVTSIATNNGLTGGTITTTGTIGLNTAGFVTNGLLTWDGSNLTATGTPNLTAGYFTATTSIASAFPYASTTMVTATIASSTNLIVSGNSTLGTVISGLWNGTSIGNSYVDDDITLTNITQITNRAISDTTGTLTVARGGTGQTSFLQGWLHSDGTTFTSSTSPTVNYIVATSTTNNSTFAGKVGVGTTTPTDPLTVHLPAVGSNSYLKIGSAAGNTFFNRFGTTANNQYAWFTNIYYTGAAFAKDDSTKGAWRMNQVTSAVSDKGNTMNFDYFPIGSVTPNTVLTVSGSSSGGNIGIGTTTPNWNLQVAGTRPFLTLSDASASANLKHWLLSPQGGNLYLATSSDAYATSTVPNLMIDSNGNLGIGTTSPYAKLSVAGVVAGQSFNADSTIASAFPYASTTALTVSGNSYLGTVSSGTWNGTLLSVPYGGTGWAAIQSGSIPYGNGTNALSTTTAGTAGYVLAYLNGVPTWTATTTLSDITGTLTVARGGTGQTSFGQGWLHSDGSTFTSSTSPTVAYLTATSTTATSTLLNTKVANLNFNTSPNANTYLYWNNVPFITATGSSMFLGLDAGKSMRNQNVAGSDLWETAVGYQALYNNTTGDNNTALGYKALYTNTTGHENTANGVQSLYSNTTGYNNTANGIQSLYSNTTGSGNIANGSFALYSNTTGSGNIANGSFALYSNTTGTGNSANGDSALYSNTTGDNNTAVGSSAGTVTASGISPNSTPNNSVYLGYNTRSYDGVNTNEIVIGALAISNGSNSVTLGNTSIIKTILRGNVGIGTSTPNWNLQIASSTKTRLALSDMSSGTNLKHWLLSSMGGNFYVGTSSDAYATSTVPNLMIDSNGNFGIGTTSPYAKLSVTGVVAGQSFNADSTTASTFPYASTTALTVSGNSYLGTVSSGTWNGTLLSVPYGGTGWAAIQSGSIPYGNGTNALSTTTAGTAGYVLAYLNGVPTWTATTTLSDITGTLSVAKGGTGQTSFGQGWLHSDGSTFTSSTSPTVAYLTATSTTATSTFAGGLSITGTGTGLNFGADTLFYQNNQRFLTSSTTSAGNLTIGYQSATGLDANGGLYNTGVGYQALGNATSTKYNTALGYQALKGSATISGIYNSNTAVGYQALLNNSTGYYNTANGLQSLVSNTTGHSNTANGLQSLYSNTTGGSNVANGLQSLYSNLSGGYNTAIGGYALYNNNYYYNTAVGYQSFYNNTTGAGNVGFGYNTGRGDGTTQDQRSVIDNYATFIGYQASRSESVASTSALTNITAIGKNARVGASNSIVLGGTGADAVNVGIGTEAPEKTFDIRGNTATFRVANATAGTTGLSIDMLNNAIGIGTTGTGSNNIRFGAMGLGTEAIRIDSNGNLGIGTTSPYAKLSVVGETVAEKFTATSTTATSTFAGGMNVAGTAGLTVLQNGNVGIGTAAPVGILHVGDTAVNNLLYSTTLGDLSIRYNTSNRVQLTQNHADTFGAGYGTNGNGGLRLGDGTNYAYVVGNGTSLLLNPITGNLGIGTTSPGTILSVSGVGNFAGTGSTLYSTLTAPYFTATSTTATSTFNGDINFGTTSNLLQGGQRFLTSSTTSAGNLTIGYQSATGLDANGGLYNTGVGYQALGNATSTKYNTALGYQALKGSATISNTGYNTAVGYKTLTNNTTGIYNTANGFQSLSANTTGVANTASGNYSLISNTTGSYNNAYGYTSLYYNTIGVGNVGFGYYTGRGDGTTQDQRSVIDNYMTFIGYQASRDSSIASTTALTNGIAIGKNARVGASNSIVLGGTGADAVNVGIGTTSPYARLSVVGETVAEKFTATSTTATSTFAGGMNVAGTAGLTVLQNGNVGIGTVTPEALMDVNGIMIHRNYMQINGASIVSGYMGPGGYVLTGPANTDIGIRATGGFSLGVNNNLSPVFAVNTAGNASLGTTSPWSRLSIQDTYGSQLPLFDIASSTSAAYATSSVFRVNANGNVGIGTTTPFDNSLTVTNKMIVSNNTGFDTGIYMDSGQGSYGLIQSINAANTSTKNLVLQQWGGNVGLGTTSPYSKLTVWGGGTGTNTTFEVANNASTTLMSVLDNGTVTLGTATAGDIIFDTSATGNVVRVGMGTSTPDADFNLVSNQTSANTYLFTISTTTGNVINRRFIVDSDGDVHYDGSLVNSADYAESFSVVGDKSDYEAGDIIVLATSTQGKVKKSEHPYESRLVGIYSTKPGIIGSLAPDITDYEIDRTNDIPVGMLGRVPVKVSLEGGAINIGDKITSSSLPGIGMKANSSGPVIGIALEPYSGEEDGKILVLLSQKEDKLDSSEIDLRNEVDKLKLEVESIKLGGSYGGSSASGTGVLSSGFNWVLDQLKNVGLVIESGILSVKEIVSEKVTTKKICIEDVCVDKSQLKELLLKNGISDVSAATGASSSSSSSSSSVTSSSSSENSSAPSASSSSSNSSLSASSVSVSSSSDSSVSSTASSISSAQSSLVGSSDSSSSVSSENSSLDSSSSAGLEDLSSGSQSSGESASVPSSPEIN